MTEPLPSAIVSAMHAAWMTWPTERTLRDMVRNRVCLSARANRRAGFQGSRSRYLGRRDFHFRRFQMRHWQHPGHFWVGQSNCRFGPGLPVYVDTNVMAGHTGPADASGRFEGLVYLEGNEANGFVPALPKERVDLIYLCYPNNPTGTVASREVLKQWVDYALANDSLILFDAAYEAFISDPSIPHSIFEIEGAKNCAIEFRSFSKSIGFTGVRCALTVVPKQLMGKTPSGKKFPFTSSGTDVSPQSSTARRMSFRRVRRLRTARKAKRR